jgi:predicted nucleotidyltransferase component of viral defense system
MNQKEIEHIALQKDILKSTIDKDWVLGHLLNTFYSFDDIKSCFVFKGGTCLKKCYFEDYRFSEDLDFTLLDKNFPINFILLNKITQKAEEVSSIRYYVPEINEQFYNDVPQGYEVKIKFWGADHKPNSPVPPVNRWQTFIKLDISFSEKMFCKPVYRQIIHPYSDSALINKTIPVYPMVEIMAEKLRSLIQRNRPRDIYDIWYIMQNAKNTNKKAIKELLLKKAETKNIQISNVDQFVNAQKLRKNKRAWESSLKQHLPINALPDFDMVYSELFKTIKIILNS